MKIDRVIDYDYNNHRDIVALYFLYDDRDKTKGFELVASCTYPEDLLRRIQDHEIDLDLSKLVLNRKEIDIITSSWYKDPNEFKRNIESWINETEDAYISENISIDKLLRKIFIKISKKIIRKIF